MSDVNISTVTTLYLYILIQNLFNCTFEYCFFWGRRTDFKKLSGIKAFFPDVPLIGMSGTLTTEQKRTIPKQLGLDSFNSQRRHLTGRTFFLKSTGKCLAVMLLRNTKRLSLNCVTNSTNKRMTSPSPCCLYLFTT